MKQVTRQHFIVTAMRTSKFPAERRTSPAEGGFDFNKEMQKKVYGNASRYAGAGQVLLIKILIPYRPAFTVFICCSLNLIGS